MWKDRLKAGLVIILASGMIGWVLLEFLVEADRQGTYRPYRSVPREP